MTRFGVQIEKTVSYRGVAQPFSNTYYYEAAVAADNTAYVNDLVDAIVALERAQHSPNISFVFARAWSQIGSKEQNDMLVQKSLSGVGTGGTGSTNMDRERAFLIRFRAGEDTRGRPVYLRKWFHLDVGAIASQSMSSGILQQTTELPTSVRTALENFGDNLKLITPGAGPQASLRSKGGRAIDGATQAHRFLEHHQLGDAWRGN